MLFLLPPTLAVAIHFVQDTWRLAQQEPRPHLLVGVSGCILSFYGAQNYPAH